MKLNDASLTPRNFLRKAHKSAWVGIFALTLLTGVLVLPLDSRADTAAEIQAKITEQNAKIKALEQEIAEYERTLNTLGGQKKTLQGEISRIDVSRKKISTDIAVSENRITAASLELSRLGGAISDKTRRIETSSAAIYKSLRSLNAIGDTTLVEHLFTAGGMVEAWQEADRLEQLQETLESEIAELEDTKEALHEDYDITEKEKAKLVSLKKQLADQKYLLDQTRKEQANLLTDTKSKESAYQKLLAEKQAAKLEFEKQLAAYEASLEYTLNPSSIPKAGSGVLGFPLDPSYMTRCKDRQATYKNLYCLTQYFGNTAFAQTGAYRGKGHNGVDFGAPEGTRVVSAASGVIAGVGNTDAAKGCYSYGKWIVVKHNNGLSTLYAHLSVQSVKVGDAVSEGSLLGLSGKTGYATGPHLHFTVLDSSGVNFIRMADIPGRNYSSPCDNAQVPAANPAAYLNPMQYL